MSTLSDSEKIAAIKRVVKDYIEDEDHWADYFMEQVCDIINDKGIPNESS